MQKKPTKKKRTQSSKSKEKVKKTRGYNESNCSLLEDGLGVGSISDLFKNEGLKKKANGLQSSGQINFNSTINNYTSVYTVISSVQAAKPQKVRSTKNIGLSKQSVAGKKKAPQKQKSKSKLVSEGKQQRRKKEAVKGEYGIQQKKQKLQSYELIPLSKNSLNSEIVFSTQQTKRESEESQKRKDESSRIYDSLTRISQENMLINNNKMLRSTIRQEFRRKNDAATKIQKVWRGYLTRKILQKYIKQEQEKLICLLNQYQSSHRQQSSTIIKEHSKQKSSEYEFFSNKGSRSSKSESPNTFQDEQSINLSKINHSQYRFNEEDSKVSSERMHSNRFFNNRQNEIVNCEREVMTSSQEEEEERQNDYQQQDDSNEDARDNEDQQSSGQDMIAYRHHEVIYNGSQIQQYLQSSSSEQQAQSQKSRREKLHHMMNKDQIIFQTNEQHLQSRKNSILNKNSQPKNQSHIIKNNQASDLVLIEEAYLQQQRVEFMKDPDLIKTSKVNSIHNHSRSHKTSARQQQLQELSPRRRKQLENKQDPSQKTSKKQCKKLVYLKSTSKEIIENEQSQTQLKVSENSRENSEHLQTIKITSAEEKYQPLNGQSKKAFMDTISYNSEFKSKHQIETVGQKIIEKKKSIKKKIYYFQDQSQKQSNYNHQQDNQLSTPSRKSNKYSPRLNSSNQLQRLKNSQLQRWDEVIRLINSQLGDFNQQKGKSKQFQGFIKQVMQLSIKNKEMLEDMLNNSNSNLKNNSTFKNSRIDQILNQKSQQEEDEKQQRWKHFKDTLSSGRRKSITQQDIAVFKPHSRIVVSSSKAQSSSKLHSQDISSPRFKPSFFKQPKQELKQKINRLQQQNMKHIEQSRVNQFSLLNNIQNDQIQQMLKVRQEMLEKRECQELTKLNEKLIRKEISQKEFLQSLTKLTDTFQAEKLSIDKAREDITKGYNAAVKLIKEAFCDAKKIGYKMPLSRSSDSYKLNKHLGFNVLSGLNNVIIDELNSKDHFFSMKHVKSVQVEENVESKEQVKVQSEESQKAVGLQERHEQHKQQNGVPKVDNELPIVIGNSSNTYSQSSESIINNLSSSHNSFINHYFDTQKSPRHQAIRLSGEANKLFGNENGDNFDDFGSLSEESQEIEFSQQQLRRFRKAQPYDPSIADLNKNMMIGKEFFQMQKTSFEHSDSTQRQQQQQNKSSTSDSEMLRLRLYRQVYEIEDNLSVSNYHYGGNKSHDPKVEFIMEKQLEFLLFQVGVQLLMKPLFSEKLLFQKRQQMFGIKRVSDDCRKQFIQIVQEIMPQPNQLYFKVNQNISPLPKQLLKCMRIDFSQQDDENQNDQEYQQIGKYQMILDQELCSTAIEKYHQILNQEKQNKLQLQMLTTDNIATLKHQFKAIAPQNWEEKAFTYLQQREKFVTNRKEHCQSIRWEFINMELHCLFDAWNQQIIELKNNKNGFSGIGLNQLTLSMIDRNKKVKSDQIQDIISMSKFKLMKILNYEDQIIQQINKQIYQQNAQHWDQETNGSRISSQSDKSLVIRLKEAQQKYGWIYAPNKDVQQEIDTQQESKWIYYSDEALSYGLELVYLVEQQLFGQMAKQIRRLSLKAQLF